MGGCQGGLSGLEASDLGAVAISAALAQACLPREAVEDVLMGCVRPAGQGQARARQAALKAGLPLGAGATTVNKMRGSGMKAAVLAHDLLLAGSGQTMAPRTPGS